MKDNKYQEFMSHITLTPEIKERVMEAIEEEIEEMEAEKADLEMVSGEDRTDRKEDFPEEGNQETGNAVLGERNKERAKAKKVYKKAGRKPSILGIGGMAAAACLLLLVGTGLGAVFAGRSYSKGDATMPVQTGQYAENDYDTSSNESAAYAEESYDGEDYDMEEEAFVEDQNYLPQEPSVSGNQDSQSVSASGSTEALAAKDKQDKSTYTDGDNGSSQSQEDKKSSQSTEKLIYTCRVTVETENYRDSIRQIRESVEKCGGFIESEYEYGDGAGYDYNSSEEEAADVSIKHNKLVIRIPMKQYDSFVNGASAFGNVTEKSQDVENITRVYKDTGTRIKALKTQEKRLLQMMEKAETISDMVTVEDRLTDVQAELESYQNSLNEMDSKIDYGTVEFSLHQVKRLSEQGQTSFARKMKNRFLDGLMVVVEFFRGLVLVLAFLLPIIPLVLIILLIIFGIRKRKMRKKAIKKAIK